MGGFSTVGGGVTKHTQLTDKEVNGVIDHADRSVTRLKLEDAPKSPASLIWSVVHGRIQWVKNSPVTGYTVVATLDAFADAALTCISADGMRNMIRLDFAAKSGYVHVMWTGDATADHSFDVKTAGADTRLGYEAVDLGNYTYIFRTTVAGSTFYCFRDDLATAKFTVTDTSYGSGCWGVGTTGTVPCFPTDLAPLFASVYSPAKPVKYFEVPVIGSGAEGDPFRARLPEEIVTDWSFDPTVKKKYALLKLKGFTDDEIAVLVPEVSMCRRNLLALTNSALIKSDRATGKPVEYVAIVRVFEQPDRHPTLRPVLDALTALRGMVGVRELTREEAIRRAKQIDPDLTDVDLTRIPPTDLNFKTILSDYIRHREGLGVKRDLIDEKLMERYLTETKGW